MELYIGQTVYFNRDFIRKFESDTKTSKSFQVTAMTDVAIGVKNVRSGRKYTLSLAAAADNMEKPPTTTMPAGKVVKRTAPAPTPPSESPPTEPEPTTPEPPPNTFTHIPPAITGGIKIKRINAITLVEVSAADNPFGGLYT